jgi:hypothetical protein
MNSSLKHSPTISEILSGSLFLALLGFSLYKSDKLFFSWIFQHKENSGAIIISSGALLLLAWLIGTTIDAIRNGIVENIVDLWSRIEWRFFFEAEYEKVKQLEEYYFAYYTLATDFVISITCFIIVATFLKIKGFISFYSFPEMIILIVIGGIFFNEAKSLRQEVRENIGNYYAKRST